MALRKGAGCQPMMYSTPYCVGTFMHATPISQVHVLWGIDAVLPEVAPQRAGGVWHGNYGLHFPKKQCGLLTWPPRTIPTTVSHLHTHSIPGYTDLDSITCTANLQYMDVQFTHSLRSIPSVSLVSFYTKTLFHCLLLYFWVHFVVYIFDLTCLCFLCLHIAWPLPVHWPHFWIMSFGGKNLLFLLLGWSQNGGNVMSTVDINLVATSNNILMLNTNYEHRNKIGQHKTISHKYR